MTSNQAILEARGVSKRFPGVQALEKADFLVRPNTVHGLVGKNGAGKTTLVNILSGMYAPTEGAVYFAGDPIHIDPMLAVKKGIAVIPQEPRVAPTLTVAENLYLGLLPSSSLGFIDWRHVKSRAREVLSRMDLDIDVNARIGDLTISERQLVSTCRAFFIQDARVVIMDETTAALSRDEEQMLYRMIEAKKRGGTGIVFISHELDEVFKVCDYVTVLRNGLVVATREVASLDAQELVDLIVGERFEEYARADELSTKDAQVVLSVDNLKYRSVLQDVSFAVHEGEILGIAGLRGAGRSELFKTIFGLYGKEGGAVRFRGQAVSIHSSAQAVRAGLFFLPEDREGEGLLAARSVKENVSISALDRLLRALGFIDNRMEDKKSSQLVQRLRIKTPSLNQPVSYLSGGNKQKVILGRGLLSDPSLFLLDEPTKGIDVETKMEIRRMIVELSKHASIVLVSSEFDDLLSICDRILVMRAGRIDREIPRKHFRESDLHHYVGGISNG